MRNFTSIFFLDLFFLVCFSPESQARKDLQQYEMELGLPKFNLSAITFLSENSLLTEVVIYVEIMYDNLQFLQSVRGFEAKYEVDLSILAGDDENAPRYSNKVWRSAVLTSEYDKTNSRNVFDVSETILELPPGEYYVIATLVDLESKRKSETQAGLTVPNYNEPGLQMGDLLLAKNIRISTDKQYEIVPNVDQVVRDSNRDMYVYYEVYPRELEEFEVNFRVLNDVGAIEYSDNYIVLANHPITRDYFSFDLSGLSHGFYVVEVEVKSGDKSVLRANHFKVLLAGLPNSVKDLDLAIDQLRYIATRKEFKSMRNAKPFLKEKLFREFWKKRDPTPETTTNELLEEYYHRIAYCNAAFGSFRDGWETDMGEVYIRYGPPSEIERHPYDQDSKPYEIWRYYDSKRYFVFVDEMGYGEYRLVTDIWP